MPPLPDIKSARVVRVGRWDDVDPSLVRSANGVRLDSTHRFHILDFRCAASPLP